ncbi:tol-pal system-associated acyl-CoA thioesterase [Hydrogenophaga sp. XSHU_21]
MNTPPLPAPRPLPVSTPFEWRVRVYWEDTDAGGIVFYANYLKFFERARTEWLRALGIEQQRLRETAGGLFVVSATQVQYHRPARLDDLLLVTAAVTEAGRASLTIAQSARRDAPGGELLCEGSIRIGWVDAQSLSPRRMPAELLCALGLA